MWVDPAQFIKQIAGAGYQARKDDLRLTLTGKVTKEGDTYLLTVADVKPGPQVFVLNPATSKDAKEHASFSGAFGALAQRVGQATEVEGFWSPPGKEGDKPRLLVRQVSSAPPAGKP